MLSANDIAKYFLTQAGANQELLSNLKLQKLLYYAQGVHLAVRDTPAFPEAIESWTHGPVVPAVYHIYKDYGANALPYPTDLDGGLYDEETRSILDEVNTVYGQFSAWRLVEMTHEESPWKETPIGKEISHDALKRYFKGQLISA